MSFYLAQPRLGAATEHVQRFDPRFWTVNFPRPMMASVVATAPDALRVECEFHHAGELAGLIWASEDAQDHPLLAYGTVRDYAHCVLQFRWRSGGVVALDAPNGPTLTIEGRDAAGVRRAWYVRLWNYAEGSPEDARVVLRFSDLQSGFALPGELLHAGDIDRMFISLVPPGYVEGSTAPLPARADGWAELSGIACWGENAMLPLADAIVPPHGVGMATAYDDAFDQAPPRLVRQIEQLGYRGPGASEVIHYVGMSHFFRLEPGEGRLLAAADGALCGPARAWHASYFAALAEAGLTPIVSLSYELFAAHCPDSWQQRAWDGAPARTGWEPPSALLSPANAQAMAWLRAVAGEFVALAEAAGLPVKFQIGEPWWWVQPQTGAICCYDDAARTALNEPVAIPDMRQALSPAQIAVLDAAGELLAASTAALTQAVRGAANAPAEVLLLAFTPTLLDPSMPELKRAGLPPGWAWPAFDRLQIEDYDWLIAGADALRRAADAELQARLGYPASAQDYVAGFVLAPETARTYWPRIDAALDAAIDAAVAGGVPRRFVWALPQVARDGYVRLPLPQPEETAVNAFDDVLFPLALGRDASTACEFSTSVAVTASGHERRNALWADARLRFDVGPGIRSEEELGALIAFFRARHGPATGFRLRDPFDSSSNGMTGVPTGTDQLLAIGDGLASSFQLVKYYGEQRRIITRPEPGSILMSVGGAAVSDWSHAGQGRIEFATAPPAGAEVSAGFRFDVPVRFAEDRLDISGVNFAAGEAPSVPLLEIREEAVGDAA